MTFIEAIKTGRPLRRRGKESWSSRNTDGSLVFTYTTGGTFIDSDHFLSTFTVSREDILAEDWEVLHPAVEITEDQFKTYWYEAVRAVDMEYRGLNDPDFFVSLVRMRLMDKLFPKEDTCSQS